MEPITPIDVARLEERRKAVAVSEIALEAEPIMGGWMCYSAPGGWENQALGLGLDGPVTGADADRLVAYYVSRGVEPKVELCPFADESLTRELSARGFTVREFDNVLFLDLRDPGAIGRLPAGAPDGVEIRVVDRDDPDAVEQYVMASSLGFFGEGESPTPGFLDSARRAARHPRSTCFVAMLEGQAVGGGGLEVADAPSGERISCLWGVSVLPHARRRGIQRALIAARLRHAREQGAVVATIGSKPGIPTERNAGRLGFGVAYTTAVVAMAGEGLTPSR